MIKYEALGRIVPTGKLKMNIHGVKVKPKHMLKHKGYTAQAMAQMRGKAQMALKNYFEMTGMNDIDDVINDMLGLTDD